MLLKGWTRTDKRAGDDRDLDYLPFLTAEEIQVVSPRYQILAGLYRTPTFLIHGAFDDLVPFAQTESTHSALVTSGEQAKIKVVQEAVHLSDLYPASHSGQQSINAVADGYKFLKSHVHR